MSRWIVFFLLAFAPGFAQTPRRLGPEDGERLRTLRNETISADGRFVAYLLQDGGARRAEPENPSADAEPAAPRDSTLHLHDLLRGDRVEIQKVVSFSLTDDGKVLVATLRAPEVKKEDAPKSPTVEPQTLPPSEGAPAAMTPPEVGVAAPAIATVVPPAHPLATEATTSPAGVKAPEVTATPLPSAASAEPEGERPPRRGEGRRGGRRGGGRSPGTEVMGAPSTPAAAPPRRPDNRPLLLRLLADGSIRTIEKVHAHWISPDGRRLLFVLVPTAEAEQGLYALDLAEGIQGEPKCLLSGHVRPSNLVWSDDGSLALFMAEEPLATPPAGAKTAATIPDQPANPVTVKVLVPPAPNAEAIASAEPPATPLPKGAPSPAAARESAPPPRPVFLYAWNPGEAAARRITLSGSPTDLVPGRSNPRLTRGLDRAFLTLEPAPKPPSPAAVASTPSTPEKESAAVTIWHWKEQEIPSMRRRRSAERKTMLAEVRLGSGLVRVLGDERLPTFTLNDDGTFGLGSDGDPYAHERTWDRGYQDHWLIDVATGQRTLLLRRSPHNPRWSRDGKSIFLQDGVSFVRIDPKTHARTSLLAQTQVPLEIDPLTGEPRGGPGEVLPSGREVLFSDGFDLWAIPLDGGIGRNLTRLGSTERQRFRHLILDEEAPFGPEGNTAWLHATDEDTKCESFFRLDLASRKLEPLLVLDKDLGNPRRARDTERWLFALQDSDECPDLWTAGPDFTEVKRVSDANRWLVEHELARTELVSWLNADGEPLQGVLFRPVGYEPGRRYPTIVYMYEKLSQGLHTFRGPGMNLNPQVWAQRGYAVLLPDIIYEMGRPGLSAVKCVVPGVQKMIDMGLTDPKRVGLCGHSWGGYETAFIITQTTLFKAAVAGAPVVNMTSAYNGIRWESGLPRQFQYERTQSRIGGTLWDYPERFIENSPVFHLDHVQTPVLILFGNEDGAVPWYQGLEFYLAMRRLGKPAVFLEYDQEGHGLRKPVNIADYTTRMLAFFDHYLKDSPAPDWLRGTDHPKPLEIPSAAPPPLTAPIPIPITDPAK